MFGLSLPTSILRCVIFVQGMSSPGLGSSIGLTGKVNAQVLRPHYPHPRWYLSYLFGRLLATTTTTTTTFIYTFLVEEKERRKITKYLRFRELSNLTAGEIYYHFPCWDVILEGHNKRDEILPYFKFEGDVCDFFLASSSDFQGTCYNSAFPPSVKFSNKKSCGGFKDFISDYFEMPYAIEHCFSSFVLFPLLGQFFHLTSDFQYIWPWFWVIYFANNGVLWEVFPRFCHA